jgi:universal bacterial protein YeaZ
MQRGHAEALMPLLLEVLAEAGMDFAGLGQIAVGVGPGSFTGIRIALAAARGVGLAAKLPVAGVDSFSAVAAALPEPPRPGETLLVVIDSKREALFGQYYDDSLTPLGEPHVLKPEALLARRPPGPLLIAGDGALCCPRRWRRGSLTGIRPWMRSPSPGWRRRARPCGSLGRSICGRRT